MLKSLIVVAALAPAVLVAEPLPGSDSPQFHSLMTRLLGADDRPAIAELHGLAATNAAALVALPVAESWFLIADSRADRTALRRHGTDWVEDLAAAAFTPAELWQGGEMSPVMTDQLDRAVSLYAAGEDRKGDALLEGWFNHMPDTAPLPPGFTDLPAAAWLKAMILEQHVGRGDRKALPVLQYWLDQDRIEGWMVLASAGDYYSGQGQPMISGLKLGANTGERLQDGRVARNLLWHEAPPPPLPEATVAMVMRDLMPRPEYAPVRGYCAAHCPANVTGCETAFVSFLSQPYHASAALTPFHDTMSEADFFASPRGAQVLLGAATLHRLGMDVPGGYRGALADNPAFQAAQSLNACFAEGVSRAQDPLPAGP